MAATRAQKVRLGLFLAIGIGTVVGGLVVLAGAKIGEKRDAYTVRYAQAEVSLSGLEVGSPVRYSGIKVGRVDDIRIDPKDVSVIVVAVSLDHGTPIAENTKANLGSMGITGLKYIELTRGLATASVRKPGDSIPAGNSAFDDLSNQAGQIAGKVSVALDNLTELTGPDMKERVASVLDRTDKLLQTLEETVAENRETLKVATARVTGTAEEFEKLSSELAGTVRRTNELIDAARPKLVRALDAGGGLLAELRQTRSKVDGLVVTLEGLMTDGRDVLGPMGVQKTMTRLNTLLKRTSLLVVQSREDIVDAVGYLREATENMSHFSRKVREDPSLLLISESDEEVK